MKIGAIRFWRDGLGIRSSNYTTGSQPLEFGLNRYWRLPGLKFYEDEAEQGGTDVRVSFELLWFYLNALVWHTQKQTRRWDDSDRDWGFYFMDRVELVLRWGKRYVSWGLPFVSLVFIKHEILSLDRQRVVHLCGRGIDDIAKVEAAKAANRAEFEYRYETIRGEVQHAIAQVTVERWTRRWKWTPFKHVDDSIWVNFSNEMGPERGSWKGGVTGCGWGMKRGETVVQCLRRMERERRFER